MSFTKKVKKMVEEILGIWVVVNIRDYPNKMMYELIFTSNKNTVQRQISYYNKDNDAVLRDIIEEVDLLL